MKKYILFLFALIIFIGCNKGHRPDSQSGSNAVVKYDYKPREIEKICSEQMKKTDTRLAELIKSPAKNFANTVVGLDTILTDLSDAVTPATFMNYVSTDKNIKAEAEKCEADVEQYMVGMMTRKDLYDAFVAASKASPRLQGEDARLVEQTLKEFRENGLFLPEDKLRDVKVLKQKLAALETEFAANLNNANDYEEVTENELEGVPASMKDRLTKLSNGKYKVTVKYTDYFPFMENARNSEARRRLNLKFENIAADKNTKILTEAIKLRQKIAALLGFKTWADYKTENRMAKNAKTVESFLNGLRPKLIRKNKQDLAALLKLKKQMEKGAKKLDPWDLRYYAYQLKKRDYTLDDEIIREYFPADRVVQKMFDVYSTILGVKFVDVPGALVWAPYVHLYEIRNAADNSFVANFFTDFVPREGKYNHAAAFTIRDGRMVDGNYVAPISAIVANFTPPASGRPSLLNHDEVETLFHEFGHIMHQTLTKAHYGSLAGSKVARDFVEAPSQMLENWVWDPAILKSVSGHYQTSKPLPDDLIKKLIAARDFNQGYFYVRQLLFALYDMELHTAKGDIDPTATYLRLYKELTTIPPVKESHFPAGFGHLMGGYDAGYYGYLWSEVYALDMFTQFQKAGLLNSHVGAEYRAKILEKGDTAPAESLLVSFLGRKPNNRAFLKRLGIQ